MKYSNKYLNMKKREFDRIEVDGITVYDESDDYCEDEVTGSDEFRLKTNEEIFTDEYMQDFAAKVDAKIAREKRQNKLISICVILGCIILIGMFCLYAYCVNFL